MSDDNVLILSEETMNVLYKFCCDCGAEIDRVGISMYSIDRNYQVCLDCDIERVTSYMADIKERLKRLEGVRDER